MALLSPNSVWPIVALLIFSPCFLLSILNFLQKSAKKERRKQMRQAMGSDHINLEEKVSICCSLLSVPTSPIQQSVSFNQYEATIQRFKYVAMHIAIALIFYSYPYSILTENILVYDNYSFNIAFHVIQLIAIIVYFRTSLMNPGIIKPHKALQPQLDEHPTESSPLKPKKETFSSTMDKINKGYKYGMHTQHTFTYICTL